MQNPESQEIIVRFFQALTELKSRKVIRGKQTFTTRYGINRWNLNTLQKDPSRDIFQTAWLTYLVKDYNVNAEWLITGKGNIFTNENKEKHKDRATPPDADRRLSCQDESSVLWLSLGLDSSYKS